MTLNCFTTVIKVTSITSTSTNSISKCPLTADNKRKEVFQLTTATVVLQYLGTKLQSSARIVTICSSRHSVLRERLHNTQPNDLTNSHSNSREEQEPTEPVTAWAEWLELQHPLQAFSVRVLHCHPLITSTRISIRNLQSRKLRPTSIKTLT